MRRFWGKLVDVVAGRPSDYGFHRPSWTRELLVIVMERLTVTALLRYRGRVRLHFLPPYCPNDNRIERIWLDLHAEVARNHQQDTMANLMKEVWRFIRKRGGWHQTRIRRLAA